MTRRYGCRVDLPDQRDYKLHYEDVTNLPQSVDHRAQCSPVMDQKTLGSCTGCALKSALEYDMRKQQEAIEALSALFIYYVERAKEGTIYSDAGASIRDGAKLMSKIGACAESLWPYDVTKFQIQPPQECYDDAKLHRSVSYRRLQQDLTQLQACLASGFPFVCGVSVYQSFESEQVAQTGMIPMPEPNESLLGGHAILIVGYNASKQVFYFKNSWGTSWNPNDQYPGYGYLPFDYLTNPQLASDFWVVRTVE